MNFDINIWLDYRNEARKIGNYISLFNKEGYLNIGRYELETLISQITVILKKSSIYLDQCNIKMPKPLWVYKRDDTTTHRSSPDFAYGHLLNK